MLKIACIVQSVTCIQYGCGREVVGGIETLIYRACNLLDLHLPLFSHVEIRRLSVHVLASILPCSAQRQHVLEHALDALLLVVIAAMHLFRVSYKDVGRARGTFARGSYVKSVTQTTGTPFWWHSLISTDGSMSSWVLLSCCEAYGSQARSRMTSPTVA